ncbi:MAG: hypothetical protein LBU89_02515, partial [Fibromonadaceae bacterium]|nr:hypothetical protein [Fibromonadaceae bacterium]
MTRFLILREFTRIAIKAHLQTLYQVSVILISNFTLIERDSYEASMKNERDRYAALKYAREEGFGRGEAKGRSEGR